MTSESDNAKFETLIKNVKKYINKPDIKIFNIRRVFREIYTLLKPDNLIMDIVKTSILHIKLLLTIFLTHCKEIEESTTSDGSKLRKNIKFLDLLKILYSQFFNSSECININDVSKLTNESIGQYILNIIYNELINCIIKMKTHRLFYLGNKNNDDLDKMHLKSILENCFIENQTICQENKEPPEENKKTPVPTVSYNKLNDVAYKYSVVNTNDDDDNKDDDDNEITFSKLDDLIIIQHDNKYYFIDIITVNKDTDTSLKNFEWKYEKAKKNYATCNSNDNLFIKDDILLSSFIEFKSDSTIEEDNIYHKIFDFCDLSNNDNPGQISDLFCLNNKCKASIIGYKTTFTGFNEKLKNNNINFIKYIILRPFSWKVDYSPEEVSKLRFYTNFFLSDFKREIKTKKFNKTDIDDLKVSVSDNKIDDDKVIDLLKLNKINENYIISIDDDYTPDFSINSLSPITYYSGKKIKINILIISPKPDPSVKENKYFKISHIDNDDYDTLQVNDFFCGANKRVIRLTKHNWGIPIDYKPALHYGTGEIKPNEYPEAYNIDRELNINRIPPAKLKPNESKYPTNDDILFHIYDLYNSENHKKKKDYNSENEYTTLFRSILSDKEYKDKEESINKFLKYKYVTASRLGVGSDGLDRRIDYGSAAVEYATSILSGGAPKKTLKNITKTDLNKTVKNIRNDIKNSGKKNKKNKIKDDRFKIKITIKNN